MEKREKARVGAIAISAHAHMENWVSRSSFATSCHTRILYVQ